MTARQRWLRIAFVVLLGGGLLFIARGRPRELPLELDLSATRPAELSGIDLVVWREGSALLRLEQRFGAAGAPDLLRATVRSQPGAAELDLTLLDRGGGARRVRGNVELVEEPPARFHAQ